jgi:hypothetical protein
MVALFAHLATFSTGYTYSVHLVEIIDRVVLQSMSDSKGRLSCKDAYLKIGK